jgi:hypothetical protein
MQTSFCHEISLPLVAEEAFRLFTPKGEEQWVPGWAPEYISPPSGEVGKEMIFTTGSGDEATLWICLEWQPAERHVRYLRATPGSRVAFVDVTCKPDGAARTTARVSYSYVPLSERGRAFVAAITPESFATGIEEWAALIREYRARQTAA